MSWYAFEFFVDTNSREAFSESHLFATSLQLISNITTYCLFAPPYILLYSSHTIEILLYKFFLNILYNAVSSEVQSKKQILSSVFGTWL